MRTSTDGAKLGLLILGLLMPAGPLIAGDGEDPVREASSEEYEALMSDTEARLAGVRTDLSLDCGLPCHDSARPRYVPANRATMHNVEETRSGLSLKFTDVYLGALPDSGGSEWGFKLSFTFLFPK